MNKSLSALLGSCFILMAAGCYTYPAAPRATVDDTYTKREKDKSDDMFKGMTSLSLADAQRIAIKNNPTYISATQAIAAARMRYYQAWGAYMPTIGLSSGVNRSISWTHHGTGNTPSDHPKDRSTNFSAGLSANLLLFDGFAREFELLSSKRGVKYQQNLEANACRTLMKAVATAYNAVLLAIENRRIAIEDRNFQMSSLKDTKYKFDAGVVPLSEVLNFEILVNNAEVSKISADYNYETAIYALAVLMGYPEGTLPATLNYTDDYKKYTPVLPAVEIYLDAALQHRPDLKAYREELAMTKYALYKTYSSFSPTISAFAELGFNSTHKSHSGYGKGYAASTTNSPSFAYGLNANWTIFNGLVRYNKMREAQANVAISEYSVAAQWFTVVGEVRAAYANYVQSIRQTNLYKKSRDLSAKQRNLVDDEYRAGNAELTRLNEAQRDLVAAETNLASSYINIQNAKAQLDSVVGVNTAEYYSTSQGAVSQVPGLETYKEDKNASANDKKCFVEEDKEEVLQDAKNAYNYAVNKLFGKSSKPAPKVVAEPAVPAKAVKAQDKKVVKASPKNVKQSATVKAKAANKAATAKAPAIPADPTKVPTNK